MTTAPEPLAASPRLSQPAARSGSPRPRDPRAKLLDTQFGLLSGAQAGTLGIGMGAVKYRIKPGGPWQRMFPGVYLTERGRPTIDQRDMAALLYAGTASMLTGRAALRRYGILQTGGVVDVLVPGTTRPADYGYVRISRTWRMPGTYLQQAAIRLTPMPRAVTRCGAERARRP